MGLGNKCKHSDCFKCSIHEANNLLSVCTNLARASESVTYVFILSVLLGFWGKDELTAFAVKLHSYFS